MIIQKEVSSPLDRSVKEMEPKGLNPFGDDDGEGLQLLTSKI